MSVWTKCTVIDISIAPGLSIAHVLLHLACSFHVRGDAQSWYYKGPEPEPRAFVGMIRLDRTTPTSRTWCANQLRYIPIEKINLPLSKFIDIDC